MTMLRNHVVDWALFITKTGKAFFAKQTLAAVTIPLKHSTYLAEQDDEQM